MSTSTMICIAVGAGAFMLLLWAMSRGKTEDSSGGEAAPTGIAWLLVLGLIVAAFFVITQ
jgi:hypothetical protein